MHLLLTGANGYIGLRLLPGLLEAGHQVTAIVRDRRRFPCEEFEKEGNRFRLIEGDFLKPEEMADFPEDIDAAYYLLHSMGVGGDFVVKEKAVAENFMAALGATSCQRIIYLSGLIPDDEKLSRHLASRRAVEDELRGGRPS